jgi:hypothetical protein
MVDRLSGNETATP